MTTRCIDPDHGVGDHLCAETTPVVAVQLPVSILADLYHALDYRYEDVDHNERIRNDQVVPSAEREMASINQAMAILLSAAERRGLDITTREDLRPADTALERKARAMTDAWRAARNIVATVYPEAHYEFSQAGPSIEIKLNATTGLVFGTCGDEFIGADVEDIYGDEWEPTGTALDTTLPNDSEDGEAIAAAILKVTLEYHHEIRDGFDNSSNS